MKSLRVKQKHDSNTHLILEIIAIFIVTPTLIYFLMPIPVLPILWVATYFIYRMLRDDSHFDKNLFWNQAEVKKNLKTILLYFTFISILISLSIYLFMPEQLFSLLKKNPILWLLIIIFYPLLSVYPQELLYRVFFFHRYDKIFKTQQALIWSSTFLFAYMHIIFHNFIAVLLTLGGGFIFASLYAKTKSIATVSLAHTLYGNLIFTIGLGEFFYNGTMRTMSHFN